MLLYTYMIRVFILACSLFAWNSYALVYDDTTKKQAPIEHGIDHPDHIPHHDNKDPIKKVTHDEIVFPRKKRKIHRLVTL